VAIPERSFRGKLNGMSQAQLAGYKLIIVPGGNSITIGLSPRLHSQFPGVQDPFDGRDV